MDAERRFSIESSDLQGVSVAVLWEQGEFTISLNLPVDTNTGDDRPLCVDLGQEEDMLMINFQPGPLTAINIEFSDQCFSSPEYLEELRRLLGTKLFEKCSLLNTLAPPIDQFGGNVTLSVEELELQVKMWLQIWDELKEETS